MKIGNSEYNSWVDYESELKVKLMSWGAMETFLRWVNEIVGKDGTVFCKYGYSDLMQFIGHAIVDYDLSWIRNRLKERFERKEHGSIKVDENSLAEIIGVIAKWQLDEELRWYHITTDRDEYERWAKASAIQGDKIASFESMQMRVKDLQTKEEQFREYLETDDAKEDHPSRCTYVPLRPRPVCNIKV